MGKREAEPADRDSKLGDLAMYAAGGGARVAKAGAYVTGGGLIATYGGTTDAVHADSRNTGYESENVAPAGKPTTVSFPDYGSESNGHQAPASTMAVGQDVHVPDMQAGTDFATNFGTDAGQPDVSLANHEAAPSVNSAPVSFGNPAFAHPSVAPAHAPEGGNGGGGAQLPAAASTPVVPGVGNLVPGLASLTDNVAHLGQALSSFQSGYPQFTPTAAHTPLADHAAVDSGQHQLGNFQGDLFGGIGDLHGFGAFASADWNFNATVGPHGVTFDPYVHVSINIGNVSAQEQVLYKALNNGIAGGLTNSVGQLGSGLGAKSGPAPGSSTNVGTTTGAAGTAPTAASTTAAESGLPAANAGLASFGSPVAPTTAMGNSVTTTHVAAPTSAAAAPTTASVATPVAATPPQITIQPVLASHSIADLTSSGSSFLTTPVSTLPLFGVHPVTSPIIPTETVTTPGTHPTLTPTDGGITTGIGTDATIAPVSPLTPPNLLKPGGLLNPSTGATAPLLPPTDGATTHDPTLVKPGVSGTLPHPETGTTHTDTPLTTVAPVPSVDSGTAPTGHTGLPTGEHTTVAPVPTATAPTASIPTHAAPIPSANTLPTHEPTIAPAPANPAITPELQPVVPSVITPLHTGVGGTGALYHPTDQHYPGLHATPAGLSSGLTYTPLSHDSGPAWHDHVVSDHHALHHQVMLF